MSCLHPKVAFWFKPQYLDWKGYRGFNKPVFVGDFRGWDNVDPPNMPLDVSDKMQAYLMPCGKCLGCRIMNAMQWQFRAECELTKYPVSAFVTLTVNEDSMEKVFPGRELQHRPFQLFMKRFRKAFGSYRYMMCGEYGTNSLRPHYHVILFGWFPNDVQLWSWNDVYANYISDSLGRLWRDPVDSSSYGFHTVAYANPATIRYLVGYVLKKCDSDCGSLRSPYLRVSTRPAIGLDWYNRYKKEIFCHGNDLTFPNSVVYSLSSGQRQALPRYFLKRFEDEADNVDYVSLKQFRLDELSKRPPVELSDLRREEDYLLQVTKESHKKRINEV